jgi:hypothetical protein
LGIEGRRIRKRGEDLESGICFGKIWGKKRRMKF